MFQEDDITLQGRQEVPGRDGYTRSELPVGPENPIGCFQQQLDPAIGIKGICPSLKYVLHVVVLPLPATDVPDHGRVGQVHEDCLLQKLIEELPAVA